MLVLLKSQFALPFLFAAAATLCSSLTQAAPHSSMQLDDFHPNCDIRQLNLTQDQQNALRTIRLEYKKASDKADRKSLRSDRTRRQSITKILSAPTFDQNAARDYVEARYLSYMDFAVDELAIQHRFFQVLNSRQQRLWLSGCLR